MDEYPHIGQHNFKDCPEWWLKFRRFAKGLRHRSEVFVHGQAVDERVLADSIKDLYYDNLSHFLVSWPAALSATAKNIRPVAATNWPLRCKRHSSICAKPARRCTEPGSIANPMWICSANTDGWNMCLSLLDGTSYAKEAAKDRCYEAKICALIDTFEDLWGEDAAELEKELNALIGRDVWAFQKGAA